MWLFTRYGFFSIAAGRPDEGAPEMVMVRARARKHLEALKRRFQTSMKKYRVEEHNDRDYKFRIILPKRVWEDTIATLAEEQTWSNFKGEAARFAKDATYSHVLHKIWHLMFDAGQEWEIEQEMLDSDSE